MGSLALPWCRVAFAALAFGVISGLPWAVTIALMAGLGVPAAALAAHLSPAADLPSLLGEAGLGAALGLFAALPLAAARLGGAIFDPRMRGEGGRAGAIAAGVVLFGAGLDRQLIRALLETFLLAPPGGAAALLGRISPIAALGAVIRFGLRLGWPA